MNLKVEVSCMCCVCRGRQVFGEDVAWVSICSYSPDVNIPLQIVLAHSVMTDVNASGMRIHVGLGRDVLSQLIISVEVSFHVDMPVKLHNRFKEFTCGMSS